VHCVLFFFCAVLFLDFDIFSCYYSHPFNYYCYLLPFCRYNRYLHQWNHLSNCNLVKTNDEMQSTDYFLLTPDRNDGFSLPDSPRKDSQPLLHLILNCTHRTFPLSFERFLAWVSLRAGGKLVQWIAHAREFGRAFGYSTLIGAHLLYNGGNTWDRTAQSICDNLPVWLIF